jgi:hypothetical protein
MRLKHYLNMANTFKVNAELYELPLTARKDDRFARIVSTGTLKIDDLIRIAVTRRTDLSPATMKAAYEILKEIALEEVCGAKQVEFGLSHYGLSAEGILIGDHAKWDSATNSLILRAASTLATRDALKDVDVNVLGMAASGTYINTLTDVVSGEVNSHLTPGGGVNLTGVKIKIAGDAPNVGLHLTEINSAATYTIPNTAIPINDPSKITFIVPADLPAGDYQLSIATQYSANTLLKEPHTFVFEYVLVCG